MLTKNFKQGDVFALKRWVGKREDMMLFANVGKDMFIVQRSMGHLSELGELVSERGAKETWVGSRTRGWKPYCIATGRVYV